MPYKAYISYNKNKNFIITYFYYIKIFNKDNVGKYSLAIGKKESFTPWGLVVAFIRARSLDKWFFKP